MLALNMCGTLCAAMHVLVNCLYLAACSTVSEIIVANTAACWFCQNEHKEMVEVIIEVMTIVNILDNLQVPWSDNPDPAEIEYKFKGMVRTAGTVFILPPQHDELIAAFEMKHAGTLLSVGAKALCKHYARVPDHPTWTCPTGSCETKSKIARSHLDKMLESAVWKNVHYLPHQELVYEIRDKLGYGMRWTMLQNPRICKFRGYLEKTR